MKYPAFTTCLCHMYSISTFITVHQLIYQIAEFSYSPVPVSAPKIQYQLGPIPNQPLEISLNTLASRFFRCYAKLLMFVPLVSAVPVSLFACIFWLSMFLRLKCKVFPNSLCAVFFSPKPITETLLHLHSTKYNHLNNLGSKMNEQTAE